MSKLLQYGVTVNFPFLHFVQTIETFSDSIFNNALNI